MDGVEGGTEEPAAIGGQPGAPQAGATTAAPEEAPLVARASVPALVLQSGHGHRARFGFFYLALGAVLAGAIAGVVVLAMQPGKPKPKPWAAWSPPSGSSSKVSNEIATHVGSEYQLGGAGGQLAAVLTGTPEVAHGLKTTTISEIAFRASASAQCCSRIISTKGTVQDQLCGLGADCAIAGGAASTTLSRLLRREVLEIALYTFKYAPGVNSVIAFMPPPTGKPPSTVLFLERSDLRQQLSEPLAKTLPLATPPSPDSLDGSEAPTIDRLTLPAEYRFDYVSLTSTTDAIVLTPGAA